MSENTTMVTDIEEMMNIGPDMNIKFAQLEQAQGIFNEENQSSIPKIQGIPTFLRENEKLVKYCTPRMISFGPLHHNNESLKEGERYKLLWTSRFVVAYGEENKITDRDRTTCILTTKIKDNIEELKNLFSLDVIKGYNDNELVWMLFVDGCSLLHFMEHLDNQNPKALSLKFDQLIHMRRDITLLENQLPRRLLEMLSKKNGADLDYLFGNYLTMGKFKEHEIVIVSIQNPKPIHILDAYRSFYLSPLKILYGNDNQRSNSDEQKTNVEGDENNNQVAPDDNDNQVTPDACWQTYKSIRDLRNAGIKVIRNKSTNTHDEHTWGNISFVSNWFCGELRLPEMFFNDFVPYLFWNMIAFEMCPDVNCNYECCSFFSFMDSLIDTAEDVKELRLAGVFQNLLGSDEDLANLINELGSDLPTKMYSNTTYNKAVGYSKKYIMVKNQIEKHYNNKCKTWLVEGYNTYFKTPWAIIAFLAALLALILTFIQTWFTIHPRK